MEAKRAERMVSGENEFFMGAEEVTQRMEKVRDAIEVVREHWGTRQEFLENEIKRALKDGKAYYLPMVLYAYQMLKDNHDTNWQEELPKDKREALDDEGYYHIKSYTETVPYDAVYSRINALYRNENYGKNKSLYHIATLLLEYLNIDLYNYTWGVKSKRLPGFQGVTYRGIHLTPDHIQKLKDRAAPDEPDRGIAIPLSLQSTSMDLDVAHKFLKKNRDQGIADHLKPIILKVRTYGLHEEHMKHYSKQYPESKVSSICAVQIKNESAKEDEDEVLLRGPFFEIVDFIEEAHTIPGIQEAVPELEMMILNSNRDHISTYRLKDKDEPARDLFKRIVNARKFEILADLHDKRKNRALSKCYDKRAADWAYFYKQVSGEPFPKVPITHPE